MNLRKIFITSTIAIGSLLLLIIILFFINSYLGKCRGEDILINETNECYYFSEECKEKETNREIEGNNACVYTPKGFLPTTTMKFILIILGIGWFIIFIIFLVFIGRKSKPLDITTFKKEDYVYPDRARELWALWFSRNYGIPIINDSYKKSAFRFYKAGEPFQRGKEKFHRFQAEVTEGTYPGIFTVNVSLSLGEKYILNGGARWQQVSYDDFKIKRSMPLYVAEDPTERLLEQLWITHPERAREVQQQVLERQLQQPKPQLEQPIQQPTVARAPYRPYYRKPWYRRRY